MDSSRQDPSGKLVQWLQQPPLELEKEQLAAGLVRSFLKFTGLSSGILALMEGDGYRLAACDPVFTSWHDMVIPAAMMGELSTLDSPRNLNGGEGDDSLAVSARSLCEFLRMQSSGALRLTPALAIPLCGGELVRGLVVLSGEEDAAPQSEDDLVSLRAMAVQATTALQNADRFERFGATFHSFLETMADAIDAKDPHGQGHSRSVSYYAGTVARQMGLSAREVQSIEIAGLLHDLGRLGIPDEILLKTGRLTEEELETVRSYPVRGAELIGKVKGLEGVAPFVRHHAERFDGKGYPDQLHGSEIPLGARILAVAHSFVAMISHRSYRAPMTVVGGALKALDGMSGQALDAEVVRAFLAALGR